MKPLFRHKDSVRVSQMIHDFEDSFRLRPEILRDTHEKLLNSGRSRSSSHTSNVRPTFSLTSKPSKIFAHLDLMDPSFPSMDRPLQIQPLSTRGQRSRTHGDLTESRGLYNPSSPRTRSKASFQNFAENHIIYFPDESFPRETIDLLGTPRAGASGSGHNLLNSPRDARIGSPRNSLGSPRRPGSPRINRDRDSSGGREGGVNSAPASPTHPYPPEPGQSDEHTGAPTLSGDGRDAITTTRPAGQRSHRRPSLSAADGVRGASKSPPREGHDKRSGGGHSPSRDKAPEPKPRAIHDSPTTAKRERKPTLEETQRNIIKGSAPAHLNKPSAVSKNKDTVEHPSAPVSRGMSSEALARPRKADSRDKSPKHRDSTGRGKNSKLSPRKERKEEEDVEASPSSDESGIATNPKEQPFRFLPISLREGEAGPGHQAEKRGDNISPKGPKHKEPAVEQHDTIHTLRQTRSMEGPKRPDLILPIPPHSSRPVGSDDRHGSLSIAGTERAPITKRNRQRNLLYDKRLLTPREEDLLTYPVQPSTMKASELFSGAADALKILNMRIARNQLIERQPSSTLLFDERTRPRQALAPVLTLAGAPLIQPLHIPQIKSRVIGRYVSTISILPESQAWNSMSYLLEQHEAIFEEQYAPFEHLIWVGITFQDFTQIDPQNLNIPYFLLTVCHRDSTLFFLETSKSGHTQWQRTITSEPNKKGKLKWRYLTSKGKLCVKSIEEELRNHYQLAHFNILPMPKATAHMLRLDEIIVQNRHFMSIGILYRKKGQNTRDEIAGNHGPPTGSFLSFLRAIGVPVSDGPHDRHTMFNGDIQIKWLLATDFDDQDFRRYIGNTLNIIIFNDSDETFDPSNLFLGKISNLVCVVQPKRSDQQIKGPPMFRVGFFLQYDVPFETDSQQGPVIFENEKTIRSIHFGPEIPHNFVFDIISIGKFVLTKIYNGMMASLKYHSTAKCFFTEPLLQYINQAVRQLLPEWHAKVAKSQRKIHN